MIILDEIEELRTLSILDNRLHHRTISSGDIYTVFQGVVLPYNLGVSVILWNLTNSLVYSNLINSDESRKIILDLNPFNDMIAEWPTTAILQHFTAKLGVLSLECDADQMSDDMTTVLS